ncbi:MAG: ABC transporter ATP-binding protein [Anaerolineae bacterium]|nr:ABC transporter ATP-binding protein [Anaerolineae bacterium]
MSNPVIQVENIGKMYRIGQVQGEYVDETLLSDVVIKTLTAPIRRLRNPDQFNALQEEFWALRNISFEVNQGEVVGMIGPNGAGKSTMLKILSRITQPTEGRAIIRGRVGSLLEVGTGFHQELTGRENVYMNGAILGMNKAEIDRKFDEIIDFSGVEQFIDTPVKRYSSGMHVRLAFAVAAHLDPEVMLVDEVLAVGDVAFQRKCLGKMGEVAQSGRTVILVSHQMEAILSLCPRTIWLDNGRIRSEGPSEEVVREYLAAMHEARTQTDIADRADRKGTGTVRFTDFRVQNEGGQVVGAIPTGDTVDFVLSYVAPDGPVVDASVWFWLRDPFTGRRLITCWSYLTGQDFMELPDKGELICRVPNFPLAPGQYSVDLTIRVERDTADKLLDAAKIDVVPGDFFGTGRKLKTVGDFVLVHDWRLNT